MTHHDPLDLDPPNYLPPAPGRLLVSEPFLSDPYFRRTVVLLCAHDAQGSFGLILNRPVDLDVSDLLEGIPRIGAPVGIGGPVESGEMFYLHTLGKLIDGSSEVIPGIHLGGDFEQLRTLLERDVRVAREVRFFIGYSGWQEDQLAKEIEQHAWLVSEAERGLVLDHKRSDLWHHALRRMGKAYAPLANFPEDPTHN